MSSTQCVQSRPVLFIKVVCDVIKDNDYYKEIQMYRKSEKVKIKI